MSDLHHFWRRWRALIIVAVAGIWTAATAIFSGYLSAYQFKANLDQFDKRLIYDQETRRIETQKPFLEKRLNIYLEVIKTASALTQIDLEVGDDRWKENANRFWQLRWGELEMVGDAGIRNAARLVGEQITHTTANPAAKQNRDMLRWAVECLADELRYSVEHTWGIEDSLKRKSILGIYVAKLPNGCNEEQSPPIVPRNMTR